MLGIKSSFGQCPLAGHRVPGAIPGMGSSDPASSRREASLLNLPDLRVRHFFRSAGRQTADGGSLHKLQTSHITSLNWTPDGDP